MLPRSTPRYYPTKEDGIVGLHEGLQTDDELDELRSGGSNDLIGDILSLMVGVFTPSDEKLLEQRKMLVTEHAQLIQRQWARMIGVESASSDIHAQVEETLHTLREVLRTLP